MRKSKKKVKLFLLLPIIVATGLVLSGCTGDDDVVNTVDNTQTESQTEVAENNSGSGDWNTNIAQCNDQCEMMGEGSMYDMCLSGCFINFAASEDDYKYCLEMDITDETVAIAQGACIVAYTSDEGPEICEEVEDTARDICYGTYVDDTGEVEYCDEIEDTIYSSMCSNLDN